MILAELKLVLWALEHGPQGPEGPIKRDKAIEIIKREIKLKSWIQLREKE